MSTIDPNVLLDTDDLSKEGGWAALMEQEDHGMMLPSEGDPAEDDVGDGLEEVARIRKLSSRHEPPYRVNVHNLLHGTSDEDVFFHFGGDSKVKDLTTFHGGANVEFYDETAMVDALNMDGEIFGGRTLRVSKDRHQRNHHGGGGYGGVHHSQSIHHVSSRSNDVRMAMGGPSPRNPPQQRRDDYTYGSGISHSQHQFRVPPPPTNYNTYQRSDSRMSDGSRSHRSSFNDLRYENNNRTGYGTYGGRSNRGGYQDGYPGGHGRGGGHHGGDVRNSGFYSERSNYDGFRPPFDRDAPGKVGQGRSRTNSHSSQASIARLSLREEKEPSTVQTVPKPSAKSIFGDARPVDSSKGLEAAEAKLQAEKAALREQAKKEALQRAEAEAAAAVAAAMRDQPWVHAPNPSHAHPHHKHPHPHHPHHTRGPGSVQLRRRSEEPQESNVSAQADTLPPLDPVHKTESATICGGSTKPAVSPRAEVDDPLPAIHDDKSIHSDKKPTSVVRTFSSHKGGMQKSATVGEMGGDSRRGGATGRGGRGGNRGAVAGEISKTDRRASTGVERPVRRRDSENKSISEKKERGRGGAKLGRGGSARQSKDERDSNSSKEPRSKNVDHTLPAPPAASAPPPLAKEEPKEVKAPTAAPIQQSGSQSSISTATEETKKKKKKSSKPAAKPVNAIANNRFAALLDAPE